MQYKTDTELINDLKKGHVLPVYFLMGEEAYFLDKVADYMQSNLLGEAESAFDQQVFYGNDVTMNQVVDAARQFPMMAERRVVILREAQLIRQLDSLVSYVENPLPSTVLVLVYRKDLDKRLKLYKALKKTAAIFVSEKLKDYRVKDWILTYVREQGGRIDLRSAEVMAESLGNDLSKVAGEVGKLMLTLPRGQDLITAEHIERHIGISKDFNVFELQDALLSRNVLKANRIVNYFSKNSNRNPIAKTLPVLFNAFSRLMIIFYLPQKSESNVASALHVHPFVAKKLLEATRRYPAGKVFKIIALLREYDARAKGVGSDATPQGELLKELVFKILN